MKHKLLFTATVVCLLWLSQLQLVQAQQITFQQTVKVDNPVAVSIDRKSNFFITDQKSNLYQFSPQGQPINTYSPPLTGKASIVEAWNVFKIMLFYDDNQRIVFLDRFLRELSTIRLSEHFDGLIRAATPSADDKLWLFNESEFSLIKFDPRLSERQIQTQLSLVLGKDRFDIRFMREYQNNVYMVDAKSGVYVFDNMGNYKKKLPFTGLNYIGFLGEEMYFLKEGHIHFFHLYNFKERQIELPVKKP
ncbi:MAG: hypothetical protein LPK19_04030, partial [Hymenobacteraceae bacterium]|nr:hypothetical protein [Hymenobacteraceae bacterium]MDX5395365.1 hypothetical protein [Hymenobacteraceae bacterium]MDX5511416.1 hypothetical protein [Hymenobacteraceae bacterium]